MDLRDYLRQNGLSQQAFGRTLNPPVSQAKVNHWLYGTRRVSLAEALQIEQSTGGQVSLQELAQLSAGERRVSHKKAPQNQKIKPVSAIKNIAAVSRGSF